MQIHNEPCISFEEYFMKYVFEVQDRCIESEAKLLFRRHRIDFVTLNRVIENDLGFGNENT